MELEKLKQIIKEVAPAAASLIGGPFAGTAVSMLSGVLMGRPDAREDEIVEAIKAADPDKLIEVRRADNELKAKAIEAGIRTDEIQAEDRSSARDMHRELRDLTTVAMAWLIMSGFFIMVAVVLGGWSKADSVLAGTLIGYVAAKADQVTSFYFGSSKGSKEKTNIMGQRLAAILPFKNAA